MTQPPVRVRPATPDDLDRLVAFNLAMARETEALTLDEPTLRSGVQRVFDDPARGFYLLAELDGDAAGSLLVTREWSDWRDADWWWVQSVYVEPACRRRGVFRALYEDVRQRAAEAGRVRGLRLYVERGNRSAHETYLALGMTRSHYEMFEEDLRPTAP
jgi:GNAT superfamily N-acetyltransferase